MVENSIRWCQRHSEVELENMSMHGLFNTISSVISACLEGFRIRRLGIVLAAGLLWATTACAQPNTTASARANQPSAQQVPEKTEAAVERARENLSDQAVNEDLLSQQGVSRARRSDGSMTSP